MKNFKIHIVFFCAVILAATSPRAAQKSSAALVLKNADFNRNSIADGKLISVLEGNVTFAFDDALIRSNKAIWYRSTGQARFTGNITVAQPDQLLSCDRMEFNRDQKRLDITGNVDFFNAREQTRIKAQQALYYLDSKNLALSKNPQLFRYDTARAETLSIVGDKMFYNDSLQEATAENNVRILKGALKSTCTKAVYSVETGMARLRMEPVITYDIHELTGDSVDLFFLDDALSGVSVMRHAKGTHLDITPRDTIITTVTGDSIYMAISDSGTLENIWTYKDAKTRYFSSKTPHLINEGFGKVMVLHFFHGTTGDLTISGNAECIYYLNEEKESGKNQADGDAIFIHFTEGKAAYLKLTGGVRGSYFAERYK